MRRLRSPATSGEGTQAPFTAAGFQTGFKWFQNLLWVITGMPCTTASPLRSQPPQAPLPSPRSAPPRPWTPPEPEAPRSSRRISRAPAGTAGAWEDTLRSRDRRCQETQLATSPDPLPDVGSSSSASQEQLPARGHEGGRQPHNWAMVGGPARGHAVGCRGLDKTWYGGLRRGKGAAGRSGGHRDRG